MGNDSMKQDCIRTTVDIPARSYRKLKAQAAANGNQHPKTINHGFLKGGRGKPGRQKRRDADCFSLFHA